MLRRTVQNPWEVVRFRKRDRLGHSLRVQLRDEPALHLEGGLQQFHIFHRIYLRDEYRVSGFGTPDWACVVDLGGNTGIFTRRAARLARRVISYEPIAENFGRLQRNIAGIERIEAVRGAVAEKSGRLRIYLPENRALSGLSSAQPGFEGKMSGRCEEVEAVSLDDLFATHRIEHCELLKIDVEGSEYRILRAAGERTFERIERIHGEYHPAGPGDILAGIGPLTEFLAERGYRVESVPSARRADQRLFFASR